MPQRKPRQRSRNGKFSNAKNMVKPVAGTDPAPKKAPAKKSMSQADKRKAMQKSRAASGKAANRALATTAAKVGEKVVKGTHEFVRDIKKKLPSPKTSMSLGRTVAINAARTGVVGAAGAAGYMAGKLMGADDLGKKLGSALYDKMNPPKKSKTAGGAPAAKPTMRPHEMASAPTVKGEVVVPKNKSVTPAGSRGKRATPADAPFKKYEGGPTKSTGYGISPKEELKLSKHLQGYGPSGEGINYPTAKQNKANLAASYPKKSGASDSSPSYKSGGGPENVGRWGSIMKSLRSGGDQMAKDKQDKNVSAADFWKKYGG